MLLLLLGGGALKEGVNEGVIKILLAAWVYPPEVVLVADGDGRKGEGGVVVNLHIDCHWTLQVVGYTLYHLSAEQGKAQQHDQQPQDPET